MLLNNKQKESCQKINTLLTNDSFLKRLCSYSNNELEQVISNLAKVINYYSITNDPLINYSVTELLSKANLLPSQTDYLIHPNNNFYTKELLLSGLNPYLSLNNSHRIHISFLDKALSVYPEHPSCHTPVYQDITKSITSSFSSPKKVYQSILKQPTGKELPIPYLTEEKIYYRSILDIRLKNAEENIKETCAKIGKKVINSIITNSPTLVVFPRKSKRYSISEKDINDNQTSTYIPPFLLSVIIIPSKYKLISICAKNKNAHPGELFDFNTGETYQTPPQEQKVSPLLTYSRYEEVSVTENFFYSNQEFTGDIDYDLDLIYGQLDSNQSRHNLSKKPIHNIESMKNRNDIGVRKRPDGSYEIRNGRHRILYLKHFYISRYLEYKKANRLDELKRHVTIPMHVESCLSDELANEYISKICNLNYHSIFLKSNINDDNPELIIISNNNAYYVSNTQELIDLYFNLKNNNFFNKYYLGPNNKNETTEYRLLFDCLILNLKEQIYQMTLIDIIRYLQSNGVIINNEEYEVTRINYHALYLSYSELQRTLKHDLIFKRPINIIRNTELKFMLKGVSEEIAEILNSNPNFLSYSWDELYEILKQYPSLSQYEKDFLEEAANQVGYQKLKITYCFNNKFPKKTKI